MRFLITPKITWKNTFTEHGSWYLSLKHWFMTKWITKQSVNGNSINSNDGWIVGGIRAVNTDTGGDTIALMPVDNTWWVSQVSHRQWALELVAGFSELQAYSQQADPEKLMQLWSLTGDWTSWEWPGPVDNPQAKQAGSRTLWTSWKWLLLNSLFLAGNVACMQGAPNHQGNRTHAPTH